MNARSFHSGVYAALAIWLIISCGSGSGGGGSGECADWSGNYELEGTCSPGVTCTGTQTGCSLNVDCSDGTKLSGSLTDTGFTFSGSSQGRQVSCSGSFAGDNL